MQTRYLILLAILVGHRHVGSCPERTLSVAKEPFSGVKIGR